MSDTVIDSSVVAKWILPEPDSAQARRILADAAASSGRLIVLDLVFPEVANAIWRQHHRRLIPLDKARRFLDALVRIPVHIEASHRLLPPGFEIAAAYDRSIYDAVFVALARDLGLKGVTADEPLCNAVRADFPEIVLLRHWP